MLCIRHKWTQWHAKDLKVGIPQHDVRGNPLRKDRTRILVRTCTKCGREAMKREY